MKYFVFDTSGALLNSYDTRTGTAAYVTASQEPQPGQTGSGNTSTGGSVSVVPKAILPLATFWTDTSPMPTDYRAMEFPVIQYGTSHAASMACDTTVSSPGYISGLNAAINGGTSSVIYFQVYKNGAPTGIIASGSSSGDRTTVRAKGGSSYTFVAGDTLSIYIRGDNSYTNQSFSATTEVTFTA